MKKIIISVFYLFFPLLLGIIVGLITSNSINYTSLIMPNFSPPKILFPIVWTILYLLMGLSYFLLKKKDNTNKQSIIYYLQLFVLQMIKISLYPTLMNEN